MACQTFGDPLLQAVLGCWNHAAIGSSSYDCLKAITQPNGVLLVIQQLPIASIANHQAIFSVVEAEAIRDALDGFQQSILADACRTSRSFQTLVDHSHQDRQAQYESGRNRYEDRQQERVQTRGRRWGAAREEVGCSHA